jgi:hypothetical protein
MRRGAAGPARVALDAEEALVGGLHQRHRCLAVAREHGRADARPRRVESGGDAPAAYRPGRAPNSSVDPNPSSAPDSAVPLARASAATAAATAGATSRLNTDGIT